MGKKKLETQAYFPISFVEMDGSFEYRRKGRDFVPLKLPYGQCRTKELAAIHKKWLQNFRSSISFD